jgi:hypothetical protein
MVHPPPAALGYFFEADVQAALLGRGLRPADIVSVPWAWQLIDGTVSSFGWVVELRDGKRAYLEYSVDEAGQERPEDVAVTILDAYAWRPILSDPAIHWFEPRHVNRWLGLLRGGNGGVPS